MGRGRNKQNQTNSGKKKLFISWSGENSKIIANELKNTLEQTVFKDSGLQCFMSEADIASGADWWNKVKNELQSCKMGILCITKENIKEPWIYFEAGAMICRGVRTVPLLINCNLQSINKTPLSHNWCVDFYSADKFIEMVEDINKEFKLLEVTRDHLRVIAKAGHEKLMSSIKPTLLELKEKRVITESVIFPKSVRYSKNNTIYISAPMASIDNAEYEKERHFLLTLKDILLQAGFKEVICPAFKVENRSDFDGQIKAINENFVSLKQIDCLIVIYPRSLPSSVLIELGYCIALSKKTVVFYRDQLPYMIQNAGEIIKHLKTFAYVTYDDIMENIIKNGMDVFEGGLDD